MSKFVALFGQFSSKQLKSLAKAGYTALSTDSPTETSIYPLAKDAKLPVITRRAAWDTLDHQLSDVTTTVGRDGNPREYNRNGGYTRDVLMCEEAHAILLGSGIGGRRLELIQSVGKPIHRASPEPEAAVIDIDAINRELQELFA
jgi:hypothetical protein